MRQRSITQRILTALFGIWFSVLVAEPMPVHVCPMHDVPSSPAAVHHTAPSSAATEVAHHHAAVSHASSAHAQPAAGQPDSEGTHACLCLGCCAGTSALSLLTTPAVNLQASITATQADRIDATDARRVVSRSAHALPFANGPPALAPSLS